MSYQYPMQSPSYSYPTDQFGYDKYLLNQKVLSFGGKYTVYNEMEQPLLYIDRPIFRLQAHVGIYADESMSRKLLTVFQDSPWQLINYSFTLLDEYEQPIAYLKRDGWMSMLRRTWHVYNTLGQEILRAEEDSWWKAMARRLPYVDIIGEWIRTNFILTLPGGQPVGEFIRRYTLTDKYILDLTADRMRVVDRRIAIGLAVLLDNAEGR